MTPQERKSWARSRGHQLCGLHFRRQHPIGRFILDFYCDARHLAVDLDGHSHGDPDQQVLDQLRTEWLNERGVRVIRFTNADVNRNLDEVLARSLGSVSSPPPALPSRPGGESDFPPVRWGRQSRRTWAGGLRGGQEMNREG